jgi:hypothetical protein
MAHYELDEDQRMRVQHALAKDEADLKRLKKSNAEEGLDVRDIDAKLRLLRGERGGKPGLIQIFSNQTEIFAEPGSDSAQLSIDDALEGKGEAGERWADWVPEPRPVEGDQVLMLDGSTLNVVTDSLGFEREGGDGKTPPTKKEIAAGVNGIFSAFVVAIDLYAAHTPDDKQKIHLVFTPPDGGWSQVPSPPVNVDEIREAVKIGESKGDDATITDLEDFGKHGDQESASEVEVKPRRKRAAAGNLAGAVRKEVARATGERKDKPKNSRKK